MVVINFLKRRQNMFKNKIAISKNFLIAICFISLILFAVNTVNAIDLNDVVSCGDTLGIEANSGINAIDKDKLENSQQDMLSQANTITLTNGKFSDIQEAINSNLNDGDTLVLNGEFTTNKAESHIIIYKNITFTSTSNGILNAKNLSSIFIVENGGSGSSFSNLVFKNGNGLYGGAIRILAKDVTIDNCLFQDNYASRGGGSIYTEYNIENNPDFGRNLLIKNSQFKNNRAEITAGAIGAYGYNTRILNCLFESNSVYNRNGGSVYGGAIQVGKEEYITNSIIKDCKFINNKAISITGTKLSHGGASCLRDGVTYENCLFERNSADFGGALTAHFSGTIKNCTFNSNTANDYGGAISNMEGVKSINLKIIDCDFNSNSAPYGGAVRLTGNSVTIDDCNFDKNYASIDGGAVFVETKIIDVVDSNFNHNSAENNGGAIFINGESTNVQNSNFTYNTAIANPKVKNDGLGGAIYINSSSDTVNNNKFEYNVARNGSAIYYDNSGKNLKITNNVMFKNQAWVYALPIYANDIYYGENVDVGAIIYGGNNIADYDNLAVSNSIYNAASNKYIVVNGEIPVLGATNSGQLYQDAREYNIDVLLTVKHSDGTVVFNNTLKSNYLGEITTKLNNLKVGTYTVTAMHFEDNYYKAIVNQTTFVVNPKIDVSVSKNTQYSEFNYRDQVVWTINVVNNGPSDASNVKVNDVLPDGLIYQSSSASVGNYANGVWNIGNLAKGKTATIKITTLINKTGDITNKATVDAKEFDWNTTNNQDSQKITVPKAIDLSIAKIANVSNPKYGDLVKWTVTVRNNGPDVASDVVLTDVLPAGLVIKSATGNFVDGKWVIGSLDSGKSQSFEVVTLVNKTGSLTNKVSVVGREYDYNPKNNNASKGINVAKAADLSVIKSVNETRPNYGDLVKWTLTVRNNGPDMASGVNVSDVLPVGLVYQSSSASVGSYANGVWSIGNLANGKTVTLSIVCKINKTGLIKNVASVSGNEFDIDLTNNRGDASVNVAKAADLEVIKTVNNGAPNYGDLVKWTVTVRNNGPDMASGVNVSDVLPEGLVYQSSSTSVGSYANGVWTIGNLDNGKTVTLTIISKVDKTGSINNIVNVSGNEYDINKTNNENNKIIDVPKACDLEVIKSVNDSSPNYHKLVRWTIIVNNNGPDNATGVLVEDILPQGLVIISSNANYTNGKWFIGNLNAFSSKILEITTLINKTGLLINNANITGNEYDFNKSNNYDNASIDVLPSADLEIQKIVSNENPLYNDTVKWIIIVKNNGPDKATGVKVNETLDDSFELVKSKLSKGFYINGIWTIGDLNAGENVYLEIITKIVKTGNFTNVVNVIGNEYDHNTSNNLANKSINVYPAIDLQITKNVNNSSPNYNDLVKWTVTVRNNGPDKANVIEIADILPKGLEFVGYNSTKGYYVDGFWKFCCLEVGETQSLDIVTRVKSIGNIKNIVSANAKEYDYNPDNNKDESEITVPPAADLEITKLVNQSVVNYTNLVKWTLIVKNNGPNEATRVVVMDKLPEGLTFVSAQGDGTYSTTGTWYVGNIASGQSKELTIITRCDKVGELTNVAVVKGDQYDYNSTNDKGEKTVVVPPAADLAITKTVSKAQYFVNDLINYTIEILNNGPSVAENISVKEFMDDSLILKSVFAASGYYDDVNQIWHINSLANGEKTYLNINAIATGDGLVNNKVSVISDTFDNNLKNNYAECIVEIIKKIIDPNSVFNPGLYSRFSNHNSLEKDLSMIAKAGIEMKSTGMPIGLLFAIALISIGICTSNISRKR